MKPTHTIPKDAIRAKLQVTKGDRIRKRTKFTISLTMTAIDELMPKGYKSLELVGLTAPAKIKGAYVLHGITVDCIYYSGFTVLKTGHRLKLPGLCTRVFDLGRISGPIGYPILVPSHRNMALHLECGDPKIRFQGEALFVPGEPDSVPDSEPNR